ncbi:MAG: twin-arginine translocase subunit TatC [Deltaproteobacteria bacterium]|nr:twin-arginine translocase subunit TatC [Deltaproteobacteria bacterium]
MDETKYTFREHLVELRSRLLRALTLVFLCTIACYFVADQLYSLLSLPMQAALPEGSSFVVTGPIEYFLVTLKLSLVAGLFLASPWVLYQFWAFIAPGLYRNEQRFALGFVVAGSLFFVGGAAFCYFLVLPLGLPLLIGLNPPEVVGMYRVGEYYSFAIGLLVAFGIAFELPVVLVLLSLLGLVDPAQLARYRKYALVLSFVAGAVLTPPDVISQTSLSLPLYFLFESGLLVSRLLVRGRGRAAEGASPPAEARL